MFALGPVGLMAVAGAKLRGAGHIIGVESVPNRQKLGELYGVDEIVDFTREDAVDRVLELTELRMQRLLRVLELQHLDPTHMTTHHFGFDEMPRAFEVADNKLDVVKVLVSF